MTLIAPPTNASLWLPDRQLRTHYLDEDPVSQERMWTVRRGYNYYGSTCHILFNNRLDDGTLGGPSRRGDPLVSTLFFTHRFHLRSPVGGAFTSLPLLSPPRALAVFTLRCRHRCHVRSRTSLHLTHTRLIRIAYTNRTVYVAFFIIFLIFCFNFFNFKNLFNFLNFLNFSIFFNA